MNYANKLGIPFVAFLGEDEINAGTVTVKDLLLPDPATPEELLGTFDLAALPTAFPDLVQVRWE